MDIKKIESLEKISQSTERTLRLWLSGQKCDLKVYRVPVSYLYFNIENGRYADKMLQLKADNPGVDIDPKQDRWKGEIYKMLKGEYTGSIGIEGTEGDKTAFERLREDIKKREQLNPGIILADGGVIDGNRRLAVLLSLTGDRFKYFDGIILPESISAEDRWRIEVGVQLGKDQKLDYSPINQLLKIRQGLHLYRTMKLPSGKTAEKMVADALYGVSVNEVGDSIDRINLIDEYLDFFKMSGQYFRVADKSERFIEAVNILKAAGKLGPHEMARLKAQLFIIIREENMSNWDMRKIKSALGGDPKARGPKKRPIRKAISHLIQHTTEPKIVRDAYSDGIQSKIREKSKTICKEFLDIYNAERNADQPITLVKEARTKLEVLKEALKDFKKVEDGPAIEKELSKIKKITKACFNTLNLTKYKCKQ